MRKLIQIIGLCLSLLFMPIQTQANTEKSIITKKKHFDFQYPRAWHPFLKPLIRNAPQQLKSLEKTFGYKFTGVIRVKISAPGKDFSKIQPTHWQPDAGIAGLAYPKQKLITLRIRQIEGMQGLQQTFQHELSHILIAHASHHHHIPLWFNEGTAMYVSHDVGDFDRFLMLSRAQFSRTLPSLKQLKWRFPGHATQRQMAYAVSLDAVSYLFRQKPQLLSQIMKAMRNKTPFDKALSKELTQPYDAILQQWQKSLQSRYGWLPLLANEGTIWLLAVLCFLLAYASVKKRRRVQWEQMEEHSPEVLH